MFLAANPLGSDALRLGAECAAIQAELCRAPHGDGFDFVSRWAVTVHDLMCQVMEIDPVVIHISGHGGGAAGLMLEDRHGHPHLVPARALAMMLQATARRARLAVLNACYSTAQAEALRDVFECVIGMDGAIGDTAARIFATRFYGALAHRRSVGNAFAQAIAALAADSLPDEVMPRCVTAADPDRLVLSPAPRRRRRA